jgi:hypothetical protein
MQAALFDRSRPDLHELRSGPGAPTLLISNLGTVELAAKEFDQASTDFGGAEATDSRKTSEAKMWMAIAQQCLGNRKGRSKSRLTSSLPLLTKNN